MANGKLNTGFKAAVRAVMLWLCLAAPAAFAGPFEDGLAAHDQKDYATALRLWRPVADQGNAAAQFNLGLMYNSGEGVQQDYVQAQVWFRRAADQGLASAQHNLGFMYGNGQGVPQDWAMARSWIRKAADQYEVNAQILLGGMYIFGLGVPQDYVQAHLWYNLAAAGSLPEDADYRKTAAIERDKLAAKMTPAQIAEAQRLAREWKPK